MDTVEHIDELTRLGLRMAQFGDDSVAHNASWYLHGTKIGWGDLAKRDVASIQAGLRDGELFVVLSEHDSHWRYAELAIDPNSTSDNPGVEYLGEHARFIITNTDAFIVINSAKASPSGEPTWSRGDMTFTVINREDARTRITV